MANNPDSEQAPTNEPAEGQEIENGPLERFLVDLAVDDYFRASFTNAADDAARRVMLEARGMAPGTINAVLSRNKGSVLARFAISDQTGLSPVAPPGETSGDDDPSAKKR